MAWALHRRHPAEFMFVAFPVPPRTRRVEELTDYLQLSPWFRGSRRNIRTAAENIRKLVRSSPPIEVNVSPETREDIPDVYGYYPSPEVNWRARPGSRLLALRRITRAAGIEGGAQIINEEPFELDSASTYLNSVQERVGQFVLDRVALVQKRAGGFAIRDFVRLPTRPEGPK